MANLNIRIPNEIADRLEILSAETDRTKTSIAKAALNSYLDRLELEVSAFKQISKLMEQKANVNSGK
jgi:predicted transcriptional regulator